MNKSKKLVTLSLLVSLALVIYVVESQIPVVFPGMKLGLANIISLVALVAIGWKEALIIMLLRTILGSIFGGTLSSFLFSIAGGFLSNIIMILLYRYFKKSLSLYIISIFGAVFHNIGQIIIASMIIQSINLFLYLPLLLISAILTGYFIGLSANFLLIHSHKIKLFLNQMEGL